MECEKVFEWVAWNWGSDARLESDLWWISVESVGYSCKSSSLSCAPDVWEPHGQRRRFLTYTLRWMYFYSVWHSGHVTLGMRCIRMCCGFDVELNGLNLGSGSFRNVDEISKQGSVCAEWYSSRMNEHLFWKWHLRAVEFDPDHTVQWVWAEFQCFPKWMDIADFECMF